MRDRKSKAQQTAGGELPFLAEGDGVELFIAAYVEAATVWRHRAHLVLANLPAAGLPLAPGPAAACRDVRRHLEGYAKALLEVADALDAAIDTDRPGDVAMLDLTKLAVAIEAFGRMTEVYDAMAAFCGGIAKPEGLADMPPWGHA